jgi:hypothetical protein
MHYTLTAYWLWLVLLFFRFIFEKNPSKTVITLIKRTKPCFHLELNTKVQTKEAFLKEKGVGESVVDETLLKIGSELVWL